MGEATYVEEKDLHAIRENFVPVTSHNDPGPLVGVVDLVSPVGVVDLPHQ